MKVLVLGAGAREHALCWRLSKSPSVQEVLCAPGNPGMAAVARLVPCPAEDTAAVCEFVRHEAVDLVVVGPELPLANGVTDALRAEGVRVVGPSAAAARLESSKVFAKEVMSAAGVPTAAFAVCRSSDEALARAAEMTLPVVVKADGLAAGKGVSICTTTDEVRQAVRRVFEELRHDSLVLEEFLRGVEVSFIVLTDGTRIVPFALSNDYKRLTDGDTGPNTGGMGAVSPTPHIDERSVMALCEGVVMPVLAEMAARGTPFSGFLYSGLMVGENGEVNVLEFNTRLGDPECQALMRRFDDDLAALLYDFATPVPAEADFQVLHDCVRWSEEAAVCVVLAAAGYPDAPRKGEAIDGVEFAAGLPAVEIFFAGVDRSGDGRLQVSGGRVLSVTATGGTVADARTRAYRAVDMVQFPGVQVRRDIAAFSG